MSYYNEQLERTLLGILILFPKHTSIIEEGIFYRTQNQLILKGIKQLWNKDGAVDIAVLCDLLPEISPPDIAKLTDGVPKSDEKNIPQIVARLKELRKKRSLDMLTDRLKESLKEIDGDEEVSQIVEKIKLEERSGQRSEHLTTKDIISAFEEYKKKGDGVKIGIPSFDNLTRGIGGGEVMYVIARPGIGKSVFMQNALRYFALNYPLGGAILFSLEMPSPQLGERMLRIESNKGEEEVRNMTEKEYEEITRQYKNIFYITKPMTIQDIYSKIIQLRFKINIRLVVIDFLTNIKTNIEGEYDSLRLITKFTKEMAKELDVGIVILSQTGRMAGGGGYYPLTMQSARGCGTIEEDGDFVLGIYDPSKNPNLNEADRLMKRNTLILQMLKSRRTAIIPKIELNFDKHSLRLTEMTERDREELK